MDEIRQIPPVTRYLLLSFAAITLPSLVGLLNLRNVGFFLPFITRQFQLWRILTSFCYAGSGLNMLFDLVFFYKTSLSLETEGYLLDSAKYAWAIGWVALGIQAANVYVGNWFLFKPLFIGLMHLWGRQNKDAKVSLFGLISIPAPYYPPVLIFLEFIQTGTFLSPLTGLLSAHLYYFLTTSLPAERQPKFLIEPPAWWRRSFVGTPNVVRTGFGSAIRGAGNAAGSGGQQAGGSTASASGHSWGSGNRLGSL